MSILSHPEWPQIRQYLRVEPYHRDTNHLGVRVRLEVVTPETPEMRAWLLGIITTCASCPASIHPVRERAAWEPWYYAVSCPWAVTLSCSHKPSASAEYDAIEADLLGSPPVPPQLLLF
jgi:hypothetical protein